MADRRILVLFWDGYLSVSPSTLGAIRMFAEGGYLVDVLMRTPSGDFPPPPPAPQGVRYLTSPRGGGAASAGPIRRRLSGYLERWRYLRAARRLVADHDYDAVLAIDDDGLAALSFLGPLRERPVLHLVLELDPYAPSRDPISRLVRARARGMRPWIDVLVIQDQARAAAWLGDRPAPEALTVRCVPHAPVGRATVTRTRFFHERLGLPPDRRIVLHAGSISPSMMSEALATAAASWPAEWSLVLHERERRDPADAYLRQVVAAGRGRVVLSLEPVPYQGLDEMFGGADVVVVLYDTALSPKHRLMAATSGKLTQAFHAGVPAVTLASVGTAELFRRYGCGSVVGTPAEFAAAIARILDDPEPFRRGAVACFDAEFEFAGHFTAVIGDLDRLASLR